MVQKAWDTLAKNSEKALSVALIGLTVSMAVPNMVQAASSGGRIGGSSFRRSPGVTRVAPRGGYSGPRGYGGYGYGGYSPVFPMPGLYMSPFITPLGGFGLGGGFGSLLLLGSVAAFAYNVVSSPRVGVESDAMGMTDEKVAVCTLKIGLLANARYIQRDLDNLARTARTDSVRDLQMLLGECVVSLLRHPDYWAYASVNTEVIREWDRAQGAFNQAAMEQRLKIENETLVNYGGKSVRERDVVGSGSELDKAPGEFIVVNIVLAASGNVGTALPKYAESEADVRRALKALGSVSEDRLQALEITWAPQNDSDTLTAAAMLRDHPDLRRI